MRQEILEKWLLKNKNIKIKDFWNLPEEKNNFKYSDVNSWLLVAE